MTTVLDKIISIARSQIGYREGRSGGHWNNIEKYAAQVPTLEWANGQAWCAVFVAWVAEKAGADGLYPRSASVAACEAWWKQHGHFNRTPSVGAQVIYNPSHTGLVVAFDASTITTVEGNTNDSGSREGDGVYLKHRSRSASNIVGYGHPQFTDNQEDDMPSPKDWTKEDWKAVDQHIWQRPLKLAGGRYTGTALAQLLNAALAIAKKLSISYDEIQGGK